MRGSQKLRWLPETEVVAETMSESDSHDGLRIADCSEFVRLYTTEVTRLSCFARTLVPNKTDAEDALQDASVVMWAKFSEFQPNTSFYAWACRIIYFEVLNNRRKLSRLSLLPESILQVLADEALRTEQGAEGDARREALRECIAKLSKQDSDLLRQRYTNDAPVAEIASDRNCSAPTIYRALTRVHRALLKCVNKGLRGEASHGIA